MGRFPRTSVRDLRSKMMEEIEDWLRNHSTFRFRLTIIFAAFAFSYVVMAAVKMSLG